MMGRKNPIKHPFDLPQIGKITISDTSPPPSPSESTTTSTLLRLTPPPTPTPFERNAAASLPMELILHILSFVPPSRQDLFAATSKVTRAWYLASQPYLYRSPKIDGKNYALFAQTITDSRSSYHLGGLVKRLDLSMIVHEGTKSGNAKILHRVSRSLEEYVAPQASFGYTSIMALGKCSKLRLLDLSLISQSINLDELHQFISPLPELEVLSFPRSSVSATTSDTPLPWPPRLRAVSLGGRVTDYFLMEESLPATIAEVWISHCPFTRQTSILHLVTSLSMQITRLSISYPMPCLAYNALDSLLLICPHLQYLLVAVDYISSHFFDPSHNSLRQLDLESSGNLGVDRKIGANDVFLAVGERRLRNLRIVRVSKRLKWRTTKQKVEDIVDLGEMLEAVATESGEARLDRVGVWEFGSAQAVGGRRSWGKERALGERAAD